MWHNAHQSAFWQAHVAHPQLAEFQDFDEAVGAVTPPQAVAISVLLDREKAGTYSGFEIPTEKTLRKIALVMGTDFRGSVALLDTRSLRSNARLRWAL